MALIIAPEGWRDFVLGKPIEALTKADIERIIPMLLKQRADLDLCGEVGHGVVANKNWVDDHR